MGPEASNGDRGANLVKYASKGAWDWYFTELREGCTERIGTYNFLTASYKKQAERIRNVYGTYRNVYLFHRIARGLHGTYRNV